MSSRNSSFKKKFAAAATLVGAFAVIQYGLSDHTDLISPAQAAQQQSAGQGQGKGQGAGGQVRPGQGKHGTAGSSTLEEKIFRGGGRRVIIVIEGDDDSDRPEWAQGNRELNPHRPNVGGKPAGAGSKKGDLYGDLWIILRDENGEPTLDEYGHVQPILADGTVIQLTPEGDVPDEYADLLVEVEFSRLSVARSPDKVTEHALEEALTKLSAATIVTVDAAGRLVVDGVTIDSPLENLSLYVYVMAGGTLPVTVEGFDVTALLGAASDKTTPVTIDALVYLNSILGINQVDLPSGTIEYYDFSTYDYTRDSYSSVMVSYLVDPDGDGTYETVTESLLDAVFDGQTWTDTTAGGADDFVQSADDSRAVISFLHEAMIVPAPTN